MCDHDGIDPPSRSGASEPDRLGVPDAVRADAAPVQTGSERVHRVKSWPHLFQPTLMGTKTHEMRRRTDRDYRVGDVMLLQEWDPKVRAYSGRELAVLITYVTDAEAPCALSGEGLHEDFCILSVRKLT